MKPVLLLRPILVALLFGLSFRALSQISPPGMDDTNAVSWGALGMNQQLGHRWSTTAYIGLARESDPDNFSLLRKPAIFVANQETQYQFNSHWQASMATSFRMQNRYVEEEPYTAASPDIRDEIRLYGRLYYRHNVHKVALTWSFRPELRLFTDRKLHAWTSGPEELRFRFKVQASIPLNASKSNQIIVANEWLSAVDKKDAGGKDYYWTSDRFTEDRLSTYFRHSFNKPALIFDVGLMHQLKIEDRGARYIAHLAFDFLFQNPFGKIKN